MKECRCVPKAEEVQLERENATELPIRNVNLCVRNNISQLH